MRLNIRLREGWEGTEVIDISRGHFLGKNIKNFSNSISVYCNSDSGLLLVTVNNNPIKKITWYREDAEPTSTRRLFDSLVSKLRSLLERSESIDISRSRDLLDTLEESFGLIRDDSKSIDSYLGSTTDTSKPSVKSSIVSVAKTLVNALKNDDRVANVKLETEDDTAYVSFVVKETYQHRVIGFDSSSYYLDYGSDEFEPVGGGAFRSINELISKLLD